MTPPVISRWIALGLTWIVIGMLLLDTQPPKYLVWAAGLGVVMLATDRTTYLPFLGECALPPTVFRTATPRALLQGADQVIKIPAPRGAVHVVWWAAESSAAMPTKAYGAFTNSGVVDLLPGDTQVMIALSSPVGEYMGLPKHVHYRGVYPNGLLGPVKTFRMPRERP